MKIDKLLDLLNELPAETEILQWDTQYDLYMPAIVGRRISMQIDIFVPVNIVRGEISRLELGSHE